jgi:phospholipase/carboxylesterase
VHALDDIGLPTTLLLVPPEAQGVRPLLVFFHGAGGAAANSLPLVQEAVAARGALALLPSSADATWDLLVGGLGRDVAALDAALDAVLGRFAVDRIAFGGFSDGASYALSLGLANGDLTGALLAFSPGFLAPPDQVGQPRVWLSHGRADTVLPVDRCGRRVVRQLQGAGYEVHYEEFAGGHVVPPALVDQALGWWLDRPATGG